MPRTESSTGVESAAAAASEVVVRRWRDGVAEELIDKVAEEVPVALTYQGVPYVVMLASPLDLEDLALGFTLSEGIAARSEVTSLEARSTAEGSYEVNIGISTERFSQLLRRQRNTTGRTGCGLCGEATVAEAIRPTPKAPEGVQVRADDLHKALRDLRARQLLNALTGSVHAAAWVVPGRGIVLVREDVGRHNALDKVIGALKRDAPDFDFSRGYFVITSRASYEMVQKTAIVGGAFLVAVSAPTAFAVRLARSAGMTLVGFARDNQRVVYCGAERLIESQASLECTSTA
ncbi:formate dehydrogenase accessory sulfurtransferase FdhD [Povalibacter sp.]|uniref:formate dehydrogenase accessory sulfurtransferase FdhD n=1 Tax=Povalibacter sp. TaxID=1962978 RepID=UPI002F419907